MKKVSSGKVREVYEADEKSLVIVTTDRISAYDVILPTMIDGKGIALNTISNFWFERTNQIIPNHILSTDLADMPSELRSDPAAYKGRTVLVKKLKMLPYELIVRGYMFGSMWDAYQKGEPFCGQTLTGEYEQAQKLAEPIFTPSSKNNVGHDENISVERMINEIGKEETDRLTRVCLELYRSCAAYAAERGIIIADTKFELGYDENGQLCLADEVLTPDSSRFWDAETYRTGTSPKSYDKQFVRDWLTENGFAGVSPAPEIPAEIAEKTAELYRTCCEKLTGTGYPA